MATDLGAGPGRVLSFHKEVCIAVASQVAVPPGWSIRLGAGHLDIRTYQLIIEAGPQLTFFAFEASKS